MGHSALCLLKILYGNPRPGVADGYSLSRPHGDLLSRDFPAVRDRESADTVVIDRNALRNVILSLQNPTDKAAACMEQLGVDVYDSEGNMRSLNDVLGDLNTSMDGMTAAEKSNIIATIFNKTDLAAVNALLANTGDTWDDLQQSIIDSGGADQQMADTQLDNLQGQLTILKSALEGLAISLGEILLPIIKNVVSGIQGFVDWLNSLDEGTKQTIVTIGLIVAAVGPVLIVIGKVISAVGTILSVVSKIGPVITVVKGAVTGLFTLLAANPVGLVIAAIL